MRIYSDLPGDRDDAVRSDMKTDMKSTVDHIVRDHTAEEDAEASTLSYAEWLGDLSVDSLYDLSVEYRKRGDPKAFELLKKAADLGSVYAQIVYGGLLVNGEICDKDIEKGLWYLEKAAKTNDARAMAAYGQALILTRDDENVRRGIDLILRSAESGDRIGAELKDALIEGGFVGR